jgi:hypothetical protein
VLDKVWEGQAPSPDRLIHPSQHRRCDPMREEPLAVIEEFQQRVNDAAGVHAIALTGVLMVASMSESIELTNRGPESSMFFGHGDPNTPDGFTYQHWKLDDLPAHLAADGPVIRALGQQWLVLVASLWNDEFRSRLAKAKGIRTNEVKDPYFGDINKMRNDIVHHGGIATERNSGRCEVLRWFSEGEVIDVRPVHVAELADYLGLAKTSRDINGDGPWTALGSFWWSPSAADSRCSQVTIRPFTPRRRRSSR